MDEEFLRAAVLGILQGLTEFLPISSSAHLLLLPWVMGWESFGLLFDVLVHGGTLLAILIYFRRDWLQLSRAFLTRGENDAPDQPGRRTAEAIVIGTLPAVFFALLSGEWLERSVRTPLVTVFTLSGFALLLLVADRIGKRRRELGSLGRLDGLWIGLGQALALIPGVSRSGITITVALLLGFKRRDSARFSFLLAGPVIAGAAGRGVLELLAGPVYGAPAVSVLAVGVVFSFGTGFLCIKYFLRFLRSGTFLPFVLYRFLLAGIILSLLLLD